MMKMNCSLCGKPLGMVPASMASASVSHGACAMEKVAAAQGRPVVNSALSALSYNQACQSRAQQVQGAYS